MNPFVVFPTGLSSNRYLTTSCGPSHLCHRLDRARTKEHGSLRHPASLRLARRLCLPRTGMSGLLEGPSFCSNLSGEPCRRARGYAGVPRCFCVYRHSSIQYTRRFAPSCQSVSGRRKHVLSHNDVLCYIQSWGKHCHYNVYMQQKHVHPHVYVNTAMSQKKELVV